MTKLEQLTPNAAVRGFAPADGVGSCAAVAWRQRGHQAGRGGLRKYLYLPRLADPAVLVNAIRGGLALLTWPQDSFAYAESYDESAGRYRGLRSGQNVSVQDHSAPGLLVKADVAIRQIDADTAARAGSGAGVGTGTGTTAGTTTGTGGTSGSGTTTAGPTKPPESPKPRRFHGKVILDSTRVGRDAGRIADEVIAHLAGLVGSTVTVTLEIEAEIPGGAPDQVVRTVTENGRTLRFTSQGFEKD